MLEEHHAWCVETWKTLDRAGQGFLTQQDMDMEPFRAALIFALGGADTRGNPSKYTRMEQSREQSMNLCAKMMAEADTNKDGLLQFEEFVEFFFKIRTSDAK